MSQTIICPNLCLPHLTKTVNHLSSSQWTFLPRCTGQKASSFTLSIFPSFCSPAQYSNLPSGINCLFKFFQIHSFPCPNSYCPSTKFSYFSYQLPQNSIIGPLSLFFPTLKNYIYLFIYLFRLCRVLVVACRIFVVACGIFVVACAI